MPRFNFEIVLTSNHVEGGDTVKYRQNVTALTEHLARRKLIVRCHREGWRVIRLKCLKRRSVP